MTSLPTRLQTQTRGQTKTRTCLTPSWWSWDSLVPNLFCSSKVVHSTTSFGQTGHVGSQFVLFYGDLKCLLLLRWWGWVVCVFAALLSHFLWTWPISGLWTCVILTIRVVVVVVVVAVSSLKYPLQHHQWIVYSPVEQLSTYLHCDWWWWQYWRHCWSVSFSSITQHKWVSQFLAQNKRQYVTLQKKIGWRKVITCWLGSAKWFWPSIFSQHAVASKRHNKA